MRTQEGNTSLCLKKIQAKLADALRLANGGVTKEEEMRLKFKRSKARIKCVLYSFALSSTCLIHSLGEDA
jgi:hypothetical protein